MTSDISIVAKLLRVNGMHIEGVEEQTEIRSKDHEEWSFEKIVVHARPIERLKCMCSKCRQPRPKYDVRGTEPSTWRGPNLNGFVVEISYLPTRINCPEHGIITEYIPWQDGKSRFLADFNNEVTYLAMTSPKTTVSEYMNINWRTVGNCISAAHDRIEPDTTIRLRGLRRVCVDETARKKGHQYITVVYDMDRNQVAWLHDGYGKEVFGEFCKQLSEEERAAMEVVAGDGAKWIDSCVKEYFPNAKRCIDFFHVVSWINEALDRTRLCVMRKAKRELDKAIQTEQAEKAERKRIEQECRKQYYAAKRELQFLRKKKGRPSKRRKDL